MGLTADRLKELNLVDRIVDEPLGGAHRDIEAMASSLKINLTEVLESLEATPMDKLLEQRYERLMQFGNYTEK